MTAERLRTHPGEIERVARFGDVRRFLAGVGIVQVACPKRFGAMPSVTCCVRSTSTSPPKSGIEALAEASANQAKGASPRSFVRMSASPPSAGEPVPTMPRWFTGLPLEP